MFWSLSSYHSQIFDCLLSCIVLQYNMHLQTLTPAKNVENESAKTRMDFYVQQYSPVNEWRQLERV